MSKTEIKRTTCYGCPLAACFVQAHVEDGKVVKVTADPELPCEKNCPRGFLDHDGRAGIEFHNMKSRINYPMKRVGKRGENKWERISWDQALDEIAAKLKDLKAKHGPHCVSVQTGTAHQSDNNWLPWRFHKGLGSVNRMGHEQICYGCNIVSMEFSFGWPVNVAPAAGQFPKCVISVGNQFEAMPHFFSMFMQVQEMGAKLICIDPRMTETAKKADLWLQGRPGADIALYMCWIRTIMKEGWYDKEFIEEWTNAPFLVRTDTKKMLWAGDLKKGLGEDTFVVWNTGKNAPALWDGEARKYIADSDVTKALSGTYNVTLADGKKVECKTAWDMLAERVEEWTPEKASEVTWIPVRKINQGCEWYAKEAPGFFVVSGHCYDTYAPGSGSVYRCRDILRMLTGSLDRTETASGCYDNKKCVSIYEMELKVDEAFTAEEKSHMIGQEYNPALSFAGYDMKAKYEKRQWGVASNAQWSCQTHHSVILQEILDDKPDRLRAIILSGSNPLLKYPNVKRVAAAMRKLDLLVALEFVMTPSAQLADYVLPMSDWFERDEIGPSLPCDIFNFIHVGAAVVKPQFERRSDYDVFRDLAIRLGFGELFPWKDLRECYNWRLKGLFEERGCADIEDFVQKFGGDWPEVTFENYKIVNGFATPTGRAEFWSVMTERLGQEPIPKYFEPSLSPYSAPELVKEYPLILIGIDRHLPNYHTMYFQVPSLRKMCPDPVMQIHPDTARRSDPPITEGDWVWIETRRGRIKQRAELTFGIHPQVVKTQHHWWFPEQPGEDPFLHGVFQSNTNVITEDDLSLCDPLFGSYPHSAMVCKVYKVTEGTHLEEGEPMY